MRLGIFAFLLFSVACSRVETNGMSSPVNDAGVEASASNGLDADLPEATGKGVIAITSRKGTETEVAVVFDSEPPTSSGPSVLGTCETVPPRDPNAPVDALGDGTSAGTVTVDAGGRSGTFRYDSGVSGYPVKMLSGGAVPLDPATPIVVTATGATVPAFELTAPAAPELVLKTRLEDGIGADAPFEVAWETPSVPGFVALWFTVETGGAVRCTAKAESGRIVVSADQVKSLLLTSGNVTAQIAMMTITDVRAGAYLVSVQHRTERSEPLPVR
jgi:hypothetical protein